MLATIRDDTWNVLNMQHIIPIRKDGIIQTFPVVAINIQAYWWNGKINDTAHNRPSKCFQVRLNSVQSPYKNTVYNNLNPLWTSFSRVLAKTQENSFNIMHL